MRFAILVPEDVLDPAERVRGEDAGKVSRSALRGKSHKLPGRGETERGVSATGRAGGTQAGESEDG